MDDEYVGRGHPPKDHQFKPGQSGNPAGRPRKKSAFERMKAIGEELVTVIIDGKRQRVTAIEAMLRKAAAKALQGDIRDARQYVALCKDLGLPSPKVEFDEREQDSNMIDEFREKMFKEMEILEKELAPMRAYFDDRAELFRSFPEFDEKLAALKQKHLGRYEDDEVLSDLKFQIEYEERKLYNT